MSIDDLIGLRIIFLIENHGPHTILEVRMLVCVLNALLNIKNKLSDILFGPLYRDVGSWE